MMGKKANLNYKLCGVGINDADYKIRECPYYARWTSILKRCYSESLHKRQPTYIGCSICDEWVYFTNFKRWMETKDWEGKYLDKDLLVSGNRVYSPETCIFVSNRVNAFLAIYSTKLKKSGLPIGVSVHKEGIYCSQASDGQGVRKLLGDFDTPLEAHQAWKAHKLQVLQNLIDTEPEDIKGVLEGLKTVITDSLKNKSVLTKEDLCGRI